LRKDQGTSSVHAQPPGHEVRPEQREHERVHGGGGAAEPAVDDARDDEELEDVRGQPHEIEEKGHRRVEAAEEAEEAGPGQARELAGRHGRAHEPAGEEHEGEAQELRAVGEGEGRGDEDVRRLVGVGLVETGLGEEGLAPLGEQGQDDEEIRGDEGGQQGVLGERHDPAVGQPGQGGHQTRQQPEGQDQGEAHVDEKEGLQALELLEAEGARRVAGDGEEAVRGELHQQAPRSAQRVVDEAEGPEDPLLAGETEDGDAEEDREDDHRRHHVVGQRAERVRRNVEVQPVDPGLARHLRRGEEGAPLVRGEGERAHEHEGEAERPQQRQGEPAPRREAPREGGRPAGDPGHEGRHDIRQHGDLEQLHEALGGQLQEGRLLPEDEAEPDAGREAEENLLREAHPA
jgi:hypothetical protein